MRALSVAIGVLAGTGAAAAQPGLTLPCRTVQGSINVEIEASKDRVADVVTIAPDLAVAVTHDLTVSVIHSIVGRTGFRGGVGGGVCVTDACAKRYDNAGVEVLYSLARGPAALAANAGVHATSFDREHYVAKLGAKARYQAGRLTLAMLPIVTIAVTARDAMVPNADRLWVPISATIAVAGGLGIGLGTGLKAPLDDTFGDAYEIALGAFATYTVSPALSLGASWIHGKLLGGKTALPDGTDGIDSRAIQVWVTVTR